MRTVLITFTDDKSVKFENVKDVVYGDVGISLTFEDHTTVVAYFNMLYAEIY